MQIHRNDISDSEVGIKMLKNKFVIEIVMNISSILRYVPQL